MAPVPPDPISLLGSCTVAAPFPDPWHRDPLLESLLADGVSLLAEWFAGAAQQPPLPMHGASAAALPSGVPRFHGLDPDQLLGDARRLMAAAYNPNHPGALAHLDPPPLVASVLGDLLAAGLNNNLLAEELSPSLSRLERELCCWLAERIGLPAGSGGVPASGGSLSNLMALVVARHQRGLDGLPEAVVLCSEDAHVSLAKAVRVMGLAPGALHTLAVDGEGRLDPEQLRQRLQDLARRSIPVIAVVATAGTTVRGAVDPLAEIAAICRQQGIWLHVDGAIGAVFALVPEQRHRLAGLGEADSVTMNPQKLLGITKTSSLLLLARPRFLRDTFATGLPYMEPSAEESHGGELGLQGTRPAEILKLWLGLRQLGLEGIGALLEGALQRRRHLQRLLAEQGHWQLHGGRFHLLAFRPARLDPRSCEHWSQRTRQELLRQGLMLSRPTYQGHHHLKAVLGNPHTQPHHLRALAAVVAESRTALVP